MVILGVFVVLAIILTWFVVKATREERSEVNRAIEICKILNLSIEYVAGFTDEIKRINETLIQ